MLRTLGPLALFATIAGCGSDPSCVEPDLTGGWTESARSTMSLSQTCDGAVSGRWTTRTEAGVVASERNVSGNVTGTRFLWKGTCVDDRCTYPTYTVDGSEGTGMDILDDGDRLQGRFSVPGRALAEIQFTRD